MKSTGKPSLSDLYVLITAEGKTVFEKRFSKLPLSIGRNLDCDIPLPQYDWISRKHAKIEWRPEGLFLVDLKSSNGITIRDQQVKEVEIYSNLSVSIGPLKIQFQCDEKTNVLQTTQPLTNSARDTQFTEINFSKNIPKDLSEEKTELANDLSEEATLLATLPDINTPPSLKKNAPFKRPKPKVHHQVPSKHLQDMESEEATAISYDKGVLGANIQGGLDAVPFHRPYRNVNRLSRTVLAVEITASWNGQILDSMICREGGVLYAGRSKDALYLPIFKRDVPVVDFRKSSATIVLPSKSGTVARAGGVASLSYELGLDGRHVKGRSWKLRPDEAVSCNLGSGVELHARYIPAPRQLTKKPLAELDLLLRRAVGASTIGHIAVMLIAAFMPREPAPKIKNLPPRIAKLLVQKPKPKPPEPKKPEPKKEVPKVVKKKVKKAKPPKKRIVKKRKIRKPRKVVVRPNKKIKRLNKVTTRVVSKKPVSQPVTTRIKQVGALAALGALGVTPPKPSSQPVSLNINKNAGGARSSAAATGLIGTLRSKNGRMAASAAPAGIKTKGRGFGTGSGYGVQGVKGTAGTRGVAGSVVGTPKLMKVKRTEGLTNKQVMDIVKKKAGRIQQCYETALLSTPGLQGRVEYKWHIKATGKVKWAKVKSSNIQNADVLNNCVTKIFKKMRFPKAKNGASTEPSIGFPFGRL